MRDLKSPVFCMSMASIENRDLPVKQCVRLRAKHRKQGFARKTRRAVTGKMTKPEICP